MGDGENKNSHDVFNEADAVSIAYQLAMVAGPPFPSHPGLRVRDLSPERQVSLGKTVTRLQHEAPDHGRTLTDSEALLIALDMFGCVCPHVPGDDAEAAYGQIRYRCIHCQAVVIESFAFPGYWLAPPPPPVSWGEEELPNV